MDRLGLISGLMVNVYYANGAMLLVPLLEAVGAYRKTGYQVLSILRKRLAFLPGAYSVRV